MERRATSSGSLRSSGRSAQRFSDVVSQGPTAIPAKEDVDAAISSALAAEGLSVRRQPEGIHHSVQQDSFRSRTHTECQSSVPSSLPRAIDNAGNGTSPSAPPTVPASLSNMGLSPTMISSQPTGGVTGAQSGGMSHPRSEVIGDGAGGIGSNASNGGGGLLDWALWPLWGTINALKWAGGTVNEVAVAPVIRLASPWGLAGSILTTIKAYTPQRARDLARIAGNFGLNAAGLLAAPAGGKVLRSTGRATSSLSMAVSSPAGRQFLLESATGMVKLAEAMDTPEAKNFIQQGAVVAARGMDALASRHTKLFVKDLADLVVRLVELANSHEATTLAAEFTVNVAHALEMEYTAGIERRAGANTASPHSADGEVGSIAGEAFAVSVDGDGGAHHLGRRVGGSVDHDAVVAGGTRVTDGPEPGGPEAAGAGEEQTLEDLVREARLERARQEGCRRGGVVCGGEEPGRAQPSRSRTAEGLQAFDGGNGGRSSDVDAHADPNEGMGEGRTSNGPDTNGANRATETSPGAPFALPEGPASPAAGAATSAAGALQSSPPQGISPRARGSVDTGVSRSDTAADGPGGETKNTSEPASDTFAADATAAHARSRPGTSGRGTESDGAESFVSGAHPEVEYERDGNARLPRFSPVDFASVLKGQPLGLEMQLEAPNEESLYDTVARALRLLPEGARCSRSPRLGTAGGGSGGDQEAGPETTGHALSSGRGRVPTATAAVRGGQSARAKAAGGWKQLLFAWLVLLFAGDGLRHRWKATFRGGESPSRPSSPTLATAQIEEDFEGPVGGSDGGGAGHNHVFSGAFLPPRCQNPASGATMVVWATPSGPCLSPALVSSDETGEGPRRQFVEGGGGGGPTCAASFRLCSAAEVTLDDVGSDARPGVGEL